MGEIPGIVFNCDQNMNSNPKLSVNICKLLQYIGHLILLKCNLRMKLLGQQIKMNPTSHLLAAFGGVIATSLLVVIILGRVIEHFCTKRFYSFKPIQSHSQILQKKIKAETEKE